MTSQTSQLYRIGETVGDADVRAATYDALVAAVALAEASLHMPLQSATGCKAGRRSSEPPATPELDQRPAKPACSERGQPPANTVPAEVPATKLRPTHRLSPVTDPPPMNHMTRPPPRTGSPHAPVDATRAVNDTRSLNLRGVGEVSAPSGIASKELRKVRGLGWGWGWG